MKLSKVTKGMLFLLLCCLAGCVDDHGFQRRPVKSVNGADYLSGEEHKANVYGTESAGLNSNQKTRPEESVLGKPDSNYVDVRLNIKPEKTESLINTSIPFVISGEYLTKTAKDIADQSGTTPNYAPIVRARYVVELNHAAGGNGSLVFDDGGMVDLSKSSDTRLVIDANGPVSIHLVTGNGYSKSKPMYYINVWQANAADPASSEIYIKKPIVLNEDGTCDDCKKGESVENDESLNSESAFQNVTTDLVNPYFELLDPDQQDVFIGSKKDLRVKLHGSCESESATSDGPVKCDPKATSEKVCWTFVRQTSVNNGSVSSSDPPFTYISDLKDSSEIGGCVDNLKVDDIFTVTVDTGTAYDATYYLNFFHVAASKVTYKINTYVMPAVLGEQGGSPGADLDGDGVSDAELEISTPKDDKGNDIMELTGRLDSEHSHDVLCKPPLSYDATVMAIVEAACGGCGSAGSFSCSLAKDGDKWIILDKDGFPIKTDKDGNPIDLDGDGKPDSVSVVIVIDDETGEVFYGGVDLDGDGDPDVAPDPCISATDPSGCSKTTQEIWCGQSEAGPFSRVCSKLTSPIQSEKDVFVKLHNNTGTPISKAINLKAELLRGGVVTNDASFEKGKDVTKTTVVTEDGLATIHMWMGTAYDALYYIQVEADAFKPVRVPVEATYFLDLPSYPGDEADKEEAEEPPSGMEGYNFDIGAVQLHIQAYDATSHATNLVKKHSITSPVYRSLGLNVIATNKSTNKPVKNAKLYWKLVRGKSPNNNATIGATSNSSDASGLANNNFYSGSAYDSVYYVTVFSPNALKDGVDPNKKDKSSTDYDFVTYTITTENFKGVVPDPDPTIIDDEEGEVIIPGEDVKCCVLRVDAKGIPNEEGICEDGTTINPKCIEYADKFKSINGHPTDPDLPQGTGCKADSTEPCMSLEIDGEAILDVILGKSQSLGSKLTMFDGKETRGVRSTIFAEIIKTCMEVGGKTVCADGFLNSDSASTNGKGYGYFNFNSGSMETTYYVNVWHPNIHRYGTKIPVQFKISTISKSMSPVDPADENVFELSVVQSDDLTKALAKHRYAINEVKYYVIKGASCDNEFILKSKTEQKQICEDTNKDQKMTNACENTITDKDNKYATPKSGSDGSIKTTSTDGKFAVYAIAYSSSPTNPSEKVIAAYACNDSGLFPLSSTVTDRDKTVYCEMSGSITKDNCIKSSRCTPNFDIPKDAETTCSYKTKIKEKRLQMDLNLQELPLKMNNGYQIRTIINLASIIVTSDGNLPSEEQCKGETSIGCTLTKVKGAYDKFIGKSDDIIDALYENIVGMFAIDNKMSQGAKNCVKYLCKSQIPEGTSVDGITSNICNGGDDNEGYKSCDCICGKFYYYSNFYEIKIPILNKKVKVGPLVRDGLESLVKSLLRKAVDPPAIEDMMCEYMDKVQYITLHGNIAFENDDPGDLKGKVNYTGLEIPFADIGFDLTKHSGVISGKWTSGKIAGSDQISLTSIPLKFSYGEALYDVLLNLLGADGKLVNLISCKSIFKNGIKVPIVNITVSADALDALCKTGLTSLDGTIMDFADSKNIDLDLDLNGTAELVKTSNCTPLADTSCAYDQIQNGTWIGTTTVNGQRSIVEGFWSGAVDKDSIPEIKKDLDEWKKTNSLCKKMLAIKHESNPTPMVSNLNCLGGTYDIDARASKNKCSEAGCNGNKSIVVCKDKVLVEEYKSASAYNIIKKANEACKGDTTEACKKNPEVVNNGNPYNCTKDGDSVTCKNSAGEEIKDETELDNLQKLLNACNDECDNPQCVMNLGWDNSKCTGGNENPEILIAEWTTFASPAETMNNEKAVAACKLTIESSAAPERVKGADNKDGAIGINAISATIKVSKDDNYEITKITFKLLGDDRQVTYNGKTDVSSYEWKSYEAKPQTGDDILVITTQNQPSMSDEPALYSMLRIDEIKVYGKKKKTTSGESSTTPPTPTEKTP